MGYLLYVHPGAWRKPGTIRSRFNGLFNLMCHQNYMIYLSIHGLHDGQKTFNCGTRYDWYVIKKTNNILLTSIKDEQGMQHVLSMLLFTWLPNYNFTIISNLITNDPINQISVIMNNSYQTRSAHVSRTETKEHKYKCVLTTPKSGIRYVYSSRNDRGHFGISKVIFGDSGLYNVIVDMKGEYGMAEHAMAILIKKYRRGRKHKKSNRKL